MKISSRVSDLLSGHDFILKYTKGHNSVNNVGGVTVFVFCHYLIMFYICTKFGKNVLKAFRVMSGHDFHTEIYKGA